METILCCVLCATAPLTLDGREITPVLDVWRLQEPVAEPEDKPEGTTIVHGALAGALAGCFYGVGVAGSGDDLSRTGSCVLNGLFFGGVGAGAVALVKWLRGLNDP